MRRRRAALAALLLALAGCEGGRPAVIVGSKNFTEQRVLGEIVAQAIEGAGLAVVRRLDLGGTFVCDAALRRGEIDVYVEYTGTALTAVLKEAPERDPGRVRARVAARYDADGLVWLEPLGFDNAFTLVVRPEVGVATISEAVVLAPRWRAAFGYEFEQRPDGYPALRRTYALAFAETRTMDLGLLYRALAGGRVDVVAGNATDGLIEALGLVALRDDRGAFPPYEAVPVVRRAALAAHPGLEAALRALGGRLDAPTMRRLNHAVDGEREPPARVARRFLTG